MRRLLDPRFLTSLIVGAILAALMLPPLVMLVQGSMLGIAAPGAPSFWTFAHFRDLFTAHRGLETMANSVVFAGGSTILSLLIGGVMAWLVERTNAPLRWLAWVADGRETEARQRGGINGRDDKLRQFAFRAALHDATDKFGPDEALAVAAGMTGPVAEAYVGGGG